MGEEVESLGSEQDSKESESRGPVERGAGRAVGGRVWMKTRM